MIVRARSVALTLAALSIVVACGDPVTPAPGAPTDLSASLSAPTTVALTWSARPSVERIENYAVYRNGRRVAETTQTTFTDAELAEEITLDYAVTAIGGFGDESPHSPVVSIRTRDAIPPRVLETIPVNGAGPLPVANRTVTLLFSEAMDSASINSATMTLKVASTGEPIPGAIRYDKRLQYAVFEANNTMPPATTITATASTGIRDRSGNALSQPHVFSFTTTENTRPRIVATIPVANATNIPLNTLIQIVFSERMNEQSLRPVMFHGSNLIVLRGPYDTLTNTLSLTPLDAMKSNSVYTVIVGWSFPALDLAGNALEGPNSFQFTTHDAGAPFVVERTPEKEAVGVDPGTIISIKFNEAIDPAGINHDDFRLYRFDGGGAVAGALSYDASTFTITFVPDAPLAPATRYALLMANIKDLSGVPTEEERSYSFTTR